jgi:putative oxidoreductase
MAGMQKVLGRYSPYFYALLRIVAGLAFAQHGAQKLFGALGAQQAAPLMSQYGAAGVIEFVGGILIALGLFTSPIAFIASGEMAVAYFMSHAPKGPWPINNGGELAVLYCFIFLYFAAVGSGKLSIDSLRK